MLPIGLACTVTGNLSRVWSTCLWWCCDDRW